MNWANVKLIWLRELRDQLRDRRTLFTVAVLPVLLYPLMGMVILQVSQFRGQEPVRLWVIGQENLPMSPPFLVQEGDGWRFASASNQSLLEITVAEADRFAGATTDDIQRAADAAISKGKYDAVVYFPPDFRQRLAAYRRNFRGRWSGEASRKIPAPQIIANTAKDRSRIALIRIESALGEWRDKIGTQAFEENFGVSIEDARPFELATIDVAESTVRRSRVWAKVLPFVLMVWALTGAFYPAIDMCAGEKERGTLETLLTSPAQRGEIVWGKLLAIMAFSMATAILNLISLGATGTFVARAIGATDLVAGQLEFGPPPLAPAGWLLLALVPAAAMFSALALAIASMARSSKEGQYYLMPLLLVSLPLMVLPVLPTTELNLGTSLVPITGLMMLLKHLMEAQYREALRYCVPVVGVTALCMLLSIRWAIDQFNKEEVLFRESEQFSLGLWLKHLVRDRRPTPSLAAAMFLGVILLVIRFFAMLSVPVPQNWNAFALLTLATLVGLIAVPALLMTWLLARSPRQTLLLKSPPPLAIFAAAALAVCLSPVVHTVAELVQFVFPITEQAKQHLEGVKALLGQAPGMWSVVLLLALVPAVCEELAFRGFILSGLRHMGHKWGAICVSAVFFGVAHGMLQQSVMACLTGVVLGFIAVQTGSLLPCIVYHFLHNALAITAATVDEHIIAAWPALEWFFVEAGEGFAFRWWVAAAGSGMAILLLLWFARLPHQATREEELQKALDHQSATAPS